MMSSGNAKIFGIGLSKTGTTSLYAALNMLGFNCGTYRHMRALGLEDWFKGDFRFDYLADYDAVTDLPLGSFYPQLFNRYPGSRFILTIRDKAAWMKSCERQLGKPPEDEFSRKTRLVTYGTEKFCRERFEYVYEVHQMNVDWFFRDCPDSLLTLDVVGGEGWEVLCPFLGVELPGDAFPHVIPGAQIKGGDAATTAYDGS